MLAPIESENEVPLFQDVGWRAFLEEDNRVLRNEVKVLKETVLLYQKMLYGKKSEKSLLAQGLLNGMIDELQKENQPQAEETNEANSAEKTQETTHAKPRKKRQGINLSNIKVECERILPQPAIEHPEKYDLLSDECAEVSDHLEYKPAKLYVHRTIRVKCALKKRNKSKNNAPICAPAPKTIIPGSYVGASLLAHIAYSKYALHLPCERQLNELARMGVPDMTNQHLCGWLEKGAQALEPLYNIIHATLFKQDALHVDETPIRCLKQEKLYGYMWLMTGSQSGQTYYHWATSRSSHELDHLLRQNNIPTSTPYQGIIITDNYVGYDSWVNNISIENQRPIQASCWTHARRKFVEAKDKCADPQFCEEIISAMKPFYSLEREIRETKDISLNEIRQKRQSNRPAILALFEKLKIYANTNAPIGVLQKAINYTVKLKERLQVYLDHPEAGIDNNPVERAVRKVAIGRKNWTFIGHPDAGRKTAIYYTMITECKRVGIDPMKWLTHVFEQIPQLKGERNQYLTLLPETYAEAQQTQN